MSQRTRKKQQRAAPPAGREERPSRRRWRLGAWIVLPVIIILAAGGYGAFRSWKGTPFTVRDSREIPNPDLSEMQGPVVRALRSAREVVLGRPSDAEAWGKFGAVLDAHHLFDEAAVCYRRAHELSPNTFQWVYLLAVMRDYTGGNQEEVVSSFAEATKINSVYPPVFYRYGEALVRQGMLAEARDAYRAATELDPDFAMAHRGLGQVLLSLRQPETGVSHLERAAALEPDDSIVHTALARGYQLLGDRRRARQAAERSKSLKPAHSVPDPVRFELESQAVDPASCRRRYRRNMDEGAYDKAIVDLKLLDEMFPDNTPLQVQLAICYERTGDEASAETFLKKAVQLDENLAVAHIRLADLLQKRGELEKAEQYYRRAVKTEPGKASYHLKLGLLLANLGTLAGAIAEFERAASLAPEDPAIRHNLGTALLRKGDCKAAMKHFRASLTLNPEHPDPHYNIGKCLEKLGRVDEAVEHYQAALRFQRNHIAAKELARLGIPPKP